MKMEQTECSETSAYKIQTPGNYPEESKQNSEHGESLKSRKISNFLNSRSRCLRGLRRESVAARLLEVRVRIPPGTWMSVYCECCILSGRGLCLGLITRPEESYRVWCLIICVCVYVCVFVCVCVCVCMCVIVKTRQ